MNEILSLSRSYNNGRLTAKEYVIAMITVVMGYLDNKVFMSWFADKMSKGFLEPDSGEGE